MAGKSAAESADVFTQAANPGPIARDQMPNRFNTTNIAAQFQDIGVVASMGMSPLTAALQQGTQISAILNSMERPLQGIAAAFTQIINPVALLSIGLTALAVVGIQTVNWSELAQKFLFLIADGINAILPYMADLILGVTALGTVMAVAFAPQILVWLAGMATSMVTVGASALVAGSQMALAWAMALSPITLVVAGIALVIGAISIFQDRLKKLLGFDIMAAIRNGLNTIIGWFIGALGGIVAMVAEAWKKIKGESSQGLTDAFTTTFNELSKKDYVGAVTDTVDSGLKIAQDKIRKFAAGININGDEKKKSGKSEAEKFADVLTQGQNRLASLNAEAEGLNLTGKAVSQLKYETELLNAAASKDITLTNERRAALRNLANEMANVDNKIAAAKFFKETDKRIAALTLENQTIMMQADAVDRLTNYTNLLNEAKEKNIELSPEFIEQMNQAADTMTKLQVETRNLKAGFDFAKDATRGFVGDMRNSLQEGASIWEAFGNAIGNVLDKIVDKILDVGVDLLFDGLSQTSGGKGLFGMIGSFISGSFGASATGASTPAVTPTMAASGAVFTNGIYDQPTPFAFAKGDSFGVMGEAGPEAVMPLQRGPDGSLGVRLNDSGGGSGPSVNVEVVVNGNANVEQESSTMADGSELRRIIINTVNEANATGAFDSSNAGRYGNTPRRTTR
jgi:hypothetical protein